MCTIKSQWPYICNKRSFFHLALSITPTSKIPKTKKQYSHNVSEGRITFDNVADVWAYVREQKLEFKKDGAPKISHIRVDSLLSLIPDLKNENTIEKTVLNARLQSLMFPIHI